MSRARPDDEEGVVEAGFAGGALDLDDEEWSRAVVDGTVVDDVWSRDVEEGGADRGAEVCVLDRAKVLVLDEDRRPCTSRSALQAYANKVVRSV